MDKPWYIFRWDSDTCDNVQEEGRASLVAQRLQIRLPTQETWIQPLVQEDPTCLRATKPVCRNCWACAPEPGSHNYWARVSQLPKPRTLEPMLQNKRSQHNEKSVHGNEE